MTTAPPPDVPRPSCVITGCPDPVDRSRQVELAVLVPPYRVWAAACRPHLANLAAIGLSVSDQPKLEDFNPTTGHRHSCDAYFDCWCAGELYAVAEDAAERARGGGVRGDGIQSRNGRGGTARRVATATP